MSDREERRARRERWLQTVAFLGAVVVFGSVLYAAFVVQGNRAQEMAPTPSPSSQVATPYDTPAGTPVPTPAAVPYPQPYIVRVLWTPGITPYPILNVYDGPYSRYIAAPGATSPLLPVLRVEVETRVAGYGSLWVDPARPLVLFGPGMTTVPASGPTPTPSPVPLGTASPTP